MASDLPCRLDLSIFDLVGRDIEVFNTDKGLEVGKPAEVNMSLT